jgi:hypothetical protein
MACRGNIVISLMLVLLLSLSGLALLTHSDLHVKIVAARKDKWRTAVALEQVLLLGLHCYREKLAADDMNAFSAPERDFFNSTVFPDLVEGDCSIRHNFSHYTLRSGDDFRLLRILDRIEASKRGCKLSAAARAGVDLLEGNIPASEFALVIDRACAEPPAAFLAGRGVEYPGSQLPLVGDLAVNTDCGRLLAEALRLDAPLPDWRRIREKFGLEPSVDPIPNGIYLSWAGEEVAAVFVEGDLERLEFSAGSGWQVIAFQQENRRRELRYEPGLASLAWSGDEEVGGSAFAEKIVVHGSVWGIEQKGAAAFLDNARIELLASGRLVVASGLESENLALRKEKIPSLLLMTSGSDFFSGEAVNADIVLDMTGKETVQAQLLGAGALVNGNAQVEIAGGLYAKDIENSGQLHVDAAAGEFSFAKYVMLRNFKLLKNFRVHFLGEENNE